MSRNKILSAVILVVAIGPPLIVSFRWRILDYFAEKAGVVLSYPTYDPVKSCASEYCVFEYKFESPQIFHGTRYWVGFHSAFLSGTVLSDEFPRGQQIEQLLKKPPNWHQYQVFEVTGRK